MSLSLSLILDMLYRVGFLILGGKATMVMLLVFTASLAYRLGVILIYSRFRALRWGSFSGGSWHWYSWCSVAGWHSGLLFVAWLGPVWGIEITFTTLLPSLIFLIWHAVKFRMLLFLFIVV